MEATRLTDVAVRAGRRRRPRRVLVPATSGVSASAASVGVLLIHSAARGFAVRLMVVVVLVVVSEVVVVPVLPMASVTSLMLLLLLMVVSLRRSIIVVIPSARLDVGVHGLATKDYLMKQMIVDSLKIIWAKIKKRQTASNQHKILVVARLSAAQHLSFVLTWTSWTELVSDAALFLFLFLRRAVPVFEPPPSLLASSAAAEGLAGGGLPTTTLTPPPLWPSLLPTTSPSR